MRYLDERGIRENTLVIFTSDHGTQLMDHGFYNKHNWYDESWRVPLDRQPAGDLAPGRAARVCDLERPGGNDPGCGRDRMRHDASV